MIRVISVFLCAALLQGCGSYRDGPVLQTTRFGSRVTVVIQAYAEGDVTYPVFVKASADGRTIESAPFLYLVPSDVESKNLPCTVKEAGQYVVVLAEADPTRLLAFACPTTGFVYPRSGDPTDAYLHSVSNAVKDIGALLGGKSLRRQ